MGELMRPRGSGLLRYLSSFVIRAFAVVEDPDEFVAGADFAADQPITQGYPTENSMSAMAAFPWVRACVLAKADDAARLPAQIKRDGELVESGAMYDLLKKPASRTTWRTWVRQQIVDYELSGNGYSLVTGGHTMTRMLPGRTKPISAGDGQIGAFDYLGTVYAWDIVLHIANASWQDSVEALIGEGPIRALHADLTAELAGKKMAAKAAQRGRLEGVITPKPTPEATGWGASVVRRIQEAIAKWSSAGTGYLVLGSMAEFTPVSVTPRDMEFSQMREETRNSILAVFGVPPARLSLPTANYATQKQQMSTYWETLKAGPIAALEDALTEMARRLEGDESISVCFDFSDVEPLQESRSERLQRVTQHILNGVDASTAYELEGFDMPEGSIVSFALPVPQTEDTPDAPAAGPNPDSEAATAQAVSLNVAQIQSAIDIVQLVALGQLPRTVGIQMLVHFFGLSQEAAEDIMGDVGIGFTIEPDDTEAQRALALEVHAKLVKVTAREWLAMAKQEHTADERGNIWRGFLDSIHAPAERAIGLAASQYLQAALKRYLERIEEVAGRREEQRTASGEVVTRALGETEILAILAFDEEFAAMVAALGSATRAALLRAFRTASIRMGVKLDFDPSRQGDMLSETVMQILDVTGETVRAIVRQLDEGATIAEVQSALQASRGFAPSRALMIARTEATRYVNNGAEQAYQQARDEVGLDVRKQWLSARDGSVRPTHVQLDGQTVEVGESFTTTAGNAAQHPGGFGIAGEDINCFLPDTEVAGSFLLATRAKYSGPVVEIKTAAGRVLTVTPNHPVATRQGLVAAQDIQVGSEALAYCPDIDTADGVRLDVQDQPATIEQVFGTFAESSGLHGIRSRAHDFHSDGAHVTGEVDIVWPGRPLRLEVVPAGSKTSKDLALAGVDVGSPGLTGSGTLSLRDGGVLAAPPSVPSRRELTVDVNVSGGPLEPLRFGSTADLDAVFDEVPPQGWTADPSAFRQRLERLPRSVCGDEVVEVRNYHFDGHVYDLQSESGVVIAGGLVSSNCRCTTLPIIGGR